ncbi:MAG: DUF2384 domain-containing protein [Bauldia sp.]|nr:DUF2384 domain-containing protein [Bauldia sp.]
MDGRAAMLGQDAKDRVTYVLAISLAIARVLRDGEAAERGWLRSARTSFEGKSALQLMLSGRMEDLLRVRQMAKDEWGP